MPLRLLPALIALLALAAISVGCRRRAEAPPASPTQAAQELRRLLADARSQLSAAASDPGEQAAARSQRQRDERVVALLARLQRLTPQLPDPDDATAARLLRAVLDVELQRARLDPAEVEPRRQYLLTLRRGCLREVDPSAVHTAALSELARIQTELLEIKARRGIDADWRQLAANLAAPRRGQALLALARASHERLSEAAPWVGDAAPTLEWRQAAEGATTNLALVRLVTSGGGQRPRIEVTADTSLHALLAIDAATTAAVGLGERYAERVSATGAHPERWRGPLEVPMFRAGWPLHAARLAHELGAYPDDVGRVGLLAFEALAAVRAAADVGQHALGLQPVQIRAMFSGHTLLDPARIKLEIDDIAREPGKAAIAFLGARDFARIAAQTRQRVGPRFNPARFYGGLLSGGAVDAIGMAEAAERYRRVEEARANPASDAR